jgi:hypothetical protein
MQTTIGKAQEAKIMYTQKSAGYSWLSEFLRVVASSNRRISLCLVSVIGAPTFDAHRLVVEGNHPDSTQSVRKESRKCKQHSRPSVLWRIGVVMIGHDSCIRCSTLRTRLLTPSHSVENDPAEMFRRAAKDSSPEETHSPR